MATDALDVNDLVFDLKSSEDFVAEDKNFDPFKTSSTNESIKELNGHKQDGSKESFPDLLGSTQPDGKNIKNALNDPFGALSHGDSLSTNTTFNNDPFANLGSNERASQNQIPDPFSNSNQVKDPFQDLAGVLPLSNYPNEIGSFTKQEGKDTFGALMGDNPDLVPEATYAHVDPFSSNKLDENAATDPFGTGLDPISNPDPFGTANPPSNSDPFGTANPPSNSDPFGTANPQSNSDPFGTANPPSNSDPFGTANPESNSDPFGTANPPNNSDQFGTESNSTSNSDPFGMSGNVDVFGIKSDASSKSDPFGTTSLPSDPDPFGTANPHNNSDPFRTVSTSTSIPDPFGAGRSDPPGNADPFGAEVNAASNSDSFGNIQDQGHTATNLFESGNRDPFGETSAKTMDKPADPFQDQGSIQTLGNPQSDLFGTDFAGDISKDDKTLKDADPFSAAPYKDQSTFPDFTEIQPQTSELSPNHSKPSNIKVLNYDDIFGDDPFHGSSSNQSKDSSNNFNSLSNQSASILNSVETKIEPEIEAAFNNSENFSNIINLKDDKTQDMTSQSGNSMTFEQPMISETKGVENPDLLEQASTLIPMETNNYLNHVDQGVSKKSQELNYFPSADKPTNVEGVTVNQPADDWTPGLDVKPSLPDVLPSLGLPDVHTSSQIQKSVEDDVGISMSDVPIHFNDDVNNKNTVEPGIKNEDEMIEDTIDLTQITSSLKDQTEEDDSEFDFEAPVIPVPARPAPVASTKPVPARPAPVSPLRPAPVAPSTNRAAPVAPSTTNAAAPSVADLAPIPTLSTLDQAAPVAPTRVKRASSRDASANVPDNTQTKPPPQAPQQEEIKSTVITSTVEDWDNIQTIQPGLKGERPPEGDQTVNKSTPIYTYEEACQTLQQADYTTVQNSLRTSVDRSGITAVVHFLFGPPKLNRDLIKGREFIFCLSASCLDNEQPSHCKMLQSIYRILTGSRFDSPRIGSHWEEIGFQGSDPGTDLRGVGILGLVQLLYFLQHTKYGQIARDIYKLSLHPTQNFPFCVMGINISRICLQSLREDFLNKEMNKRKDVMSVVNDFYIGSYYYLYTLWKQGKTIADSGFVLKDVETFAKKHTKDVFRSLETYKPGGGEATLIKTEGQEEFFSVCKE